MGMKLPKAVEIPVRRIHSDMLSALSRRYIFRNVPAILKIGLRNSYLVGQSERKHRFKKPLKNPTPPPASDIKNDVVSTPPTAPGTDITSRYLQVREDGSERVQDGDGGSGSLS
ncbi:hypothetical protein EJ08DRAFT_701791 [Tothia fuscella]|uniref:Uncharacterized protein n=1 Tax=Tothia fuscella TaxID=1048955 RepID=A0A9P4TTY3_9PEZI|nr:hypothetical protein EJ08DRAFT_701791 [Tothia fuscella]